MIGSVWQSDAIELDHLHREFGATRAVDDICFSVPAGSVFGYIGPNGAGKTTSMRILATLEMPTSGDARVEGLSSVNDPDKVRSRLGFMPDSFGTYPDTNCAEYLDFFARAYGLQGRHRTQRLRWVMDFTGLKPLAEKPMRGLSKGMRQRLCLGRALIHDPAVLVLDEPAAGLDPRARIELRRIIRAVAAEGKAVLISSHILTELAEMCDRIGIIERGKLLANGTVQEIRHQLQPLRHVRVRVIGDPTLASEVLLRSPGVDNLQLEDDILHFAMQGGDEAQAAVLAQLMQAGVAVCEFFPRDQSLEDVFLQITQGKVQ